MIDRRTVLAGLAGLGATTALPALAQGIGRQTDPYGQVDPYADPRNGGAGGAAAPRPTQAPKPRGVFEGRGRYTAEEEAEEIALGRLSQAYNTKKWGGAHPDQRLQQALRDFFLPMTRYADRSHLPWEVTLVMDDNANACAMGGGKVLVATGLIPICDRAGELAATLAHEIGHVDLCHVVQHEQIDFDEIQHLLNAGPGGANVEKALKQLGLKVDTGKFFELAYSRDDEYAADEHAFVIFDRMGADPIHILNDQLNFDTYNQLTGGEGSEYLMSHPRSENRVANVERTAARMNRPIKDYQFAGWDILKAAFPTLPPFRKA